MWINLEKLDLSYNKICNIDSLALNKSLDLYLTHNRIKRLKTNNNSNRLNSFILYSNLIFDIDSNYFIRFSTLYSLNLSNNKLTKLDKDIFKPLENLEKLWLQDNYLSYLKANTFEKLANLKELNLNGNELSEIDPDAFSSLNQLENLDLGRNEIKYIDTKWFESLSNLQELSLNHNKLTSVHEDTFRGLSRLEILRLYGNKLGIYENTFNLPNLNELF